MQILLAGASGTIGSALRARLLSQGHQVRALTRPSSKTAPWPPGWVWSGRAGSVPPAAIDWADAVVSLNGAPLAHLPWTRRYRRTIIDSRVGPTAALAQAIAQAASPPQVWVAASAVGYYGSALTPAAPPLTEVSPSGSGFLAGVVRAWEAATQPAWTVTRVVRARTGLVLAHQTGAIAPLALAARLGLAPQIGSGEQWWPWISLADEVRAWGFLLIAQQVSGPVNLVGPTPATAGQIIAELAAQLHRPQWLHLPAELLTGLMGPPAGELLLASQQVRPVKLLEHGFQFRHPTAAAALRETL